MTARNWAPARQHGRGNGGHAVRQGERSLVEGDPEDHNCGKSRDARPMRAGTWTDPDKFPHPAPQAGGVEAGLKPAAMSAAPGYRDRTTSSTAAIAGSCTPSPCWGPGKAAAAGSLDFSRREDGPESEH